jgi:zinc transporter ZupT
LFLTASSALSRKTVSRGQQGSSANLRWQAKEAVHRALEDIETQASNTTPDDHDQDHDEKPWGEVIVASLIINLVFLSGLYFVAFGTLTRKHHGSSLKYKGWKFTSNIIPSFACGALLATTAFLNIPESFGMIVSHLESHSGEDSLSDDDSLAEEVDDHADHVRPFLEDEHEDHEDEQDFESAVAWRFGTCILACFLIPVITGILVAGDEHKPKECDVCEEDKIPNKLIYEGSPKDSTSVDPVINYSLAAGLLLGDFFHNFVDGISLGTAFTLCTYDLAVTISDATVYHEIAQEIADLFYKRRFYLMALEL